jgi:hypothetical protein
MAQKNETKDTAAQKSYAVQSNLLHSRKMYRKGDVVQLTADEAAPLLQSGAVKEK